MNMQKTDGRFDVLLRAAYVGYDDKDADYLAAVDTSDVKIPQRVRNRITRKIRVYFKRKNETKTTRVARKTALVLAILVGLTFLLCLSVSGIRNRVLNSVFSEHDEFNSYDYGKDQNDENSSIIIEEYRAPAYIPQNVEGEIVCQDVISYEIVYGFDEKGMIFYSEEKRDLNTTIGVNNENCVITEEKINGFDGQMYIYQDGSIYLIWLDDEYLYQITSTVDGITKEDIIKMAESVE